MFEIQGDVSMLQQGRLVQLQLQLPEQPGLIALPPEAMYGADKIYRVDQDNRLRLLQVERVGETIIGTGASKVLIRAPGLQPGTIVLATQLPAAVDGLLVKPVGQAQ